MKGVYYEVSEIKKKLQIGSLGLGRRWKKDKNKTIPSQIDAYENALCLEEKEVIFV